MSTHRLLGLAALGASLLLAVVAAPTPAFAKAAPVPALPQVSSAQQGATWLASQFNASGYIPSPTTPGQADLSATANAVLALASSGNRTTALAGLNYLASNVNAYVTDSGSDGPGELALLILDAHALGVDPTTFGGTNLVSRLEATRQTTGVDAGLYGAQDPTYDGAYRQGLALAALAAVGVTAPAAVGSAETWLEDQQCPDGGWTSYIAASNPCDGTPADYDGPDTNSTALAVQGLSAQGALTKTTAAKALKWVKKAEDADGGWGYDPNTKATPGSSDPDSTALVIQAVLALGKNPAKGFTKDGIDPVASLLADQITSGAGEGAFVYPGISGANLVATYEAVPALAGVDVPFNLKVTTTSLPAATVGAKYSATLSASGGRSPYTWKLLSGTLPAGLKLKKSGVVAGKPTATGSATVTVEVLDTKSSTTPKTQDIAWGAVTVTVGS